MPNKEIVYRLLKKFRDYISKLKMLKKYSFDEFEKDIKINWAIDRGLQLVIECSIDIGKELITGLNLDKPDFYAQTFKILQENNIINDDLSKQMQRLVRFRNRLVHEYLFVDQKEIYDILQEDLGFFEDFLYTVEEYVKNIES